MNKNNPQWKGLDNNRIIELCAQLASATNDAVDIMIDVELERLTAIADLMVSEQNEAKTGPTGDEPEIE